VSVGWDGLDSIFRHILVGRFGLGMVLFGATGRHRLEVGDLASWLTATALWIGIALGLLVFASRRHPEK
jgi:hypothetical protein